MSKTSPTVWIILALLFAHPCHGQNQRVVVDLQLDSAGKIIDAQATSGNPVLFEAAISAAKARNYRGDCDTKGNPVKSSVRVYVDFDENGKFDKLELPIMVGHGIAESTILKKVNPDFPSELKRAGIKGMVILQARIDKRGNVVEAHAIRGDSRLALYAVRALLQWKYRPTYIGCEPVPIVATISVMFPGR